MDLRLILALASFATAAASASIVACGEVLGSDDSTELPSRDAATDAADDQAGPSDATTSDGSGGDAALKWSCTTTEAPTIHASSQACIGARADAACDETVNPPDGGCEKNSEGGAFCTPCRQINTSYQFEVQTCTCQP